MLATPEIVQTQAQDAAVIHLVVPRAEMMQVFGPAMGELMTTLSAQGVKPAGAIFAHHLKMTPEHFDFELGVGVGAPISAAGRVKPGRLPAVKAARTVYGGPYQDLPAAWDELMGWMKANGHRHADGLWEVYLIGPDASADPADWRTELNRPLAG